MNTNMHDEPAERAHARLMAFMSQLCVATSSEAAQIRLRSPKVEDFSWIVKCAGHPPNGDPYIRREREARAANKVVDYLLAPEPFRNSCWIAELDGAYVGAIMLLGVSATTAEIDAFFVEPSTRRLDVADCLIKTCVEFAIDSGYERVLSAPDPLFDLDAETFKRFGFVSSDGQRSWAKQV
ncbi:GNAT family N-acetyltransferase [Caballeronia sp.]|uniref:GNAT family N-acetyltransferase n=1 Tax=Caballeronia sp. TaxID=1931223 RepID=UPI003C528DD1